MQASNGKLGFAAVVSLLLALWSASRGMSGLITAINIAYEEKERRGFFKLNLIAIGLTLGLAGQRHCRPLARGNSARGRTAVRPRRGHKMAMLLRNGRC